MRRMLASSTLIFLYSCFKLITKGLIWNVFLAKTFAAKFHQQIYLCIYLNKTLKDTKQGIYFQASQRLQPLVLTPDVLVLLAMSQRGRGGMETGSTLSRGTGENPMDESRASNRMTCVSHVQYQDKSFNLAPCLDRASKLRWQGWFFPPAPGASAPLPG